MRPRRRTVSRTAAAGGDAAEVVNALRRLFKAIHEHSRAVLRDTGLSGPQIWALTVLRASPRLSLASLSDRLFAHPSTVSGILDRLEERGAVRRTPDPKDGRAIRIALTPRGRRLADSSPPPVQVGLQRALAAMSPARLGQLRRGLDALVRATGAAGVDAPFFDPGARPRRTARRPRPRA